MATLSLQLLLAKNKLRSFWGTGRPALHKAADYSVVLQQNGEADPRSPFYPSLLTTKALVSSAHSLWERPSHCSSFFFPTSYLISQLSDTLIRVKSENPKQVYILAHCRCVFSCTCVHVMCNMKSPLPGGPHLYVNVCIVSVFSVCTYLIKKHIFVNSLLVNPLKSFALSRLQVCGRVTVHLLTSGLQVFILDKNSTSFHDDFWNESNSICLSPQLCLASILLRLFYCRFCLHISIMFRRRSTWRFKAKCHFVFLADPARFIVCMRMGLHCGRWQTESVGSEKQSTNASASLRLSILFIPLTISLHLRLVHPLLFISVLHTKL